MKDPVICDSKVFYDGEFAAERAVAKAEYRWNQEFEAYKCGTHWHIAHKNPTERGQYPYKEKKDWCDACQQIIKPTRYWKHVQTGSHKRLEAMLKEKNQG